MKRLTALICGFILGVTAPLLLGDNTKVPNAEVCAYKRVEGRELKLYIFRPADWKTNDLRPAIVFFHGGGWVGGAPSSFIRQSEYFASRGLVCITVEYRLLPSDSKIPPIMCIQDARSAMRWVRGHAAELGIDPQRIASAGGSAGGHLAAQVGMMDGTDDPADDLKTSPKSNAMILFNPVLDNGPGEFGAVRIGNRYQELSPAHNVSRDDPPAVVFVGSKDKINSVATLEKFRAKMLAAGVRCDLLVYEGQEHAFFNRGEFFAITVREADTFLQSLGWLKGKPTIEVSDDESAGGSPP
jgi:acetyl esterase